MGVLDELLKQKQEKIAEEKVNNDLVPILDKYANMSDEDFMINLVDALGVMKLACEGKKEKISDKETWGNIDMRPLLKKASEEIKRLQKEVSANKTAEELKEKTVNSGLRLNPDKIREIVKEGKEENIKELLSLTSDNIGELSNEGEKYGSTPIERWQHAILNI